MAGQADDFKDRSLGPIHIIKYLYLADLALAAKNGGQTFTGIRWRFHHFGPWATEAWESLDRALGKTGATKNTFESQYDDKENVRWVWKDDVAYVEHERELPLVVVSAIRRAVHQFGTDTFPLLHHVYKTEPMLNAAPEEYLDFSFAVPDESHASKGGDVIDMSLSKKKMKARKKRLQELKDRVRAKLEAPTGQPKMIYPNPPPRYDEVFAEGQRWIDEIAGGPVPESVGELQIDESIWTHSSRTESDVP